MTAAPQPSPRPASEPLLDVVEALSSTPDAAGAAPYLRVYFRCANAYLRVYRRADATAYAARCPKCGKTMRFAVGPGGTQQRFFELSC